jgi:hypothetical protein
MEGNFMGGGLCEKSPCAPLNWESISFEYFVRLSFQQIFHASKPRLALAWLRIDHAGCFLPGTFARKNSWREFAINVACAGCHARCMGTELDSPLLLALGSEQLTAKERQQCEQR